MTVKEHGEIAADQVLTAEEGIAVQQRIAAQRGLQQWHWMGNYGNVYDPINVANQAGIGAAQLIMNINFANGLIATWMFY
jgi:hypothetical protein